MIDTPEPLQKPLSADEQQGILAIGQDSVQANGNRVSEAIQPKRPNCSPFERETLAKKRKTTGASSFEDTSKPAEQMTSTELTTRQDGTVQKVRKTKIVKKRRRPARPQQDPATFKTERPTQTGT